MHHRKFVGLAAAILVLSGLLLPAQASQAAALSGSSPSALEQKELVPGGLDLKLTGYSGSSSGGGGTGTPMAGSPAAADKQAKLSQMLDALKAAPDEEAASMLENRVLHTWLQAGTPAVTLLMSRGLRLLQAGQNDDAIESFSDAITLAPDVAEAWHQRAIARYHGGDVTGAIRDLQESIVREPRDFAAFHTLADIATARDDWKGAYAAWQKVMELDPKTPGGADRLRELKRHAVGEDT